MNKIKKVLESENVRHFIAYLFVGGLATIVEWAFFYIFDNVMHIQYLVATALAFVISTFANWGFGRIFTFKSVEGKHHLLKELAAIYAASAFGLLLNLIIMWILHGKLEINEMIAKIIATGLVFIYNYLIRKLVIYKGRSKKV